MAGPTNTTYEAAGSVKVSLLEQKDVVRDSSNVQTQAVQVVDQDLSYSLIASAVSGTGVSYPNIGDGIVDGYSAGTPSITLDASGVPTTLEGVGLLVAIMSGTGVGEVRRIISYVGASRVATLNAAFATAPTPASSTYTLLVDLYRLTQLHIKAEINSATATHTMSLRPLFYDRGQNSQDVSLRALRASPSTEIILGHSTLNENVTQGGYYHLNTVTLTSRGFTGVRLHVVNASSQTFSLWAGGS